MNAPLAPPFPRNPSIGQWFQNWVWNGSMWVCSAQSGIRTIIRYFDVSGPYQPSPGLVTAVVELVGGGGGGGGALGSIPSNVPGSTEPGWVCSGGGGAGGTYVRSAIPAALVQGGVLVTIGQGGAAGPAIQSSYGGKGGPTTFGGFALADGGWGGGSNVFGLPGFSGSGHDPNFGQGADPALEPPGTTGGAAGHPGEQQLANIGDIGGFGWAGTSGESNFYDPAEQAAGQSILSGGMGGGTLMGGTWAAARQIGGGQNGRPGYFCGAGGGGAISAYSFEPFTGGPGGNGRCVVTEYCWADAGRVDDCCAPWPGPGPCPPGWGGRPPWFGPFGGEGNEG